MSCAGTVPSRNSRQSPPNWTARKRNAEKRRPGNPHRGGPLAVKADAELRRTAHALCHLPSILARIDVSVTYAIPGENALMAYVIAEPCIGTKDTACVDACPVDCIHPKKDDPKHPDEQMLYIDPVE